MTGDLASLPSVSETLDPVLINEYRVNEASLNLRNSDKKYNNDTAGNFWATNGLNPCGFQNGYEKSTQSISTAIAVGTGLRTSYFPG